jgi:hypothetical protein
VTREATDAGPSSASETDSEPTVVLESTFLPSGKVTRREYPVERESIIPGHEPDHWPVLAIDGDDRLLLDTDDLRAVWTGPGPWKGDQS